MTLFGCFILGNVRADMHTLSQMPDILNTVHKLYNAKTLTKVKVIVNSQC